MEKSQIRKFAVWARQELLRQVQAAAGRYGVWPGGAAEAAHQVVNDRILSEDELRGREALLGAIESQGWEAVMEEAAYTWFNRFCAIRYMEVNGYLPEQLRALSGEGGDPRPQILRDAPDLAADGVLPGLSERDVLRWKESGDEEGLYQALFLSLCRRLGGDLPGLFSELHAYTVLLFPAGLLQEGSLLRRLTGDIPEEDWRDAVQIIGWLYQYYNSEKKDEVFAALKKNIKITKDTIPAATQLFTPDWIVRYMAENSLGRLYLTSHPEAAADFLPSAEERALFRKTGKDCGKWQYYLPEAAQEGEAVERLAKLRAARQGRSVTELRVIDPCCGSGHILVYLFDMLMAMYEAEGWQRWYAAAAIVENNLYGLDIDSRAAQLSYFAVMMKARQYDQRWLTRRIAPHVYAVPDSTGMDGAAIAALFGGNEKQREEAENLIREFEGGREYGSLLSITPCDWDGLEEALPQAESSLFRDAAAAELRPLIEAGRALSQRYDAVVTNPPYMGSANMDKPLSDFVKKRYPDSKSDLFAVFMERCLAIAKEQGIAGMITQHAWMFLSSFEKLRKKLLSAADIETMAHLGPRAFDDIGGEVVQTTAFTMRNTKVEGYKGTYCRLISPTTQDGKRDLFLEGKSRYTASQDNFSKIPGSPLAYWVSKQLLADFEQGISLGEIAQPKQGIATTDNNRFVRNWNEVDFNNIGFGLKSPIQARKSNFKWFPMNKGGEFRKWYGNRNYIVNYQNDGEEIKLNVLKKYPYLKTPDFVVKNSIYYFKECISWSKISVSNICFRYFEPGFIFSDAGMAMIVDGEKIKYIFGLMNSKVSFTILQVIAPTTNFEAGHMERIPVRKEVFSVNEISERIDGIVEISKQDWDSFEISWDFQASPLLPEEGETTLAETYRRWQAACEERFCALRRHEEELNRIFIGIYGLSEELTPDVAERDVTVARVYDSAGEIPASMKGNGYVLTKADAARQFLSYAVGCMMGRYSLDRPGLVYAGGDFDPAAYRRFPADADGILPLTDRDYFGEDDIIRRLADFLAAAFGRESAEANLAFLAGALGSGEPREVLLRYFLNDFYKDHCKMYKKRPIYWLFDSGKKNGCKALVYLHRYRPDTLARLRTKYLHQLQERYRTAADDMTRREKAAGSQAEKVRLARALSALSAQREEARLYEEKIHHLADQMIALDLDDGVKVNYAKFGDVLAKIK